VLVSDELENDDGLNPGLTQGLRITIGYSGNLGGLYVLVLYSIAGLE